LLFPRQQRSGLQQGEILWGPLGHSQVLNILKNPRYAGVYYYGRFRHSTLPNGKHTSKKLPQEQWHTFLPNSHKAYISFEEYERNQKQLLQNSQAYGQDREKRPPREGPALLQGIVICGLCGRRMTIRYHARMAGDLYPTYVCQKSAVDFAERICQNIPGTGIDEAIGELLLTSMTPLTLEVALKVQARLHAQLEEADALRKKRVKRAQYEAEIARQRYMQVDPQNRLVADSLETEWNEKLRAVIEAQEEYEQQRKADEQILTAEQKGQILSLASDFSKLWNNKTTPDREKKRMVRLILEDVTLTRKEQVLVNIRFKGGATKMLTLPLPLCAWMERKTRPEIVEEVDRLLEHHHDTEIANILNSSGLKTGSKLAFTPIAVRRIRRAYKIQDRYTRLRKKGLLTRTEMMAHFGTTHNTLKSWKDKGWIKVHSYGNTTHSILYELPGEEFVAKIKKTNPTRWKDFSSGNKQPVAGGVVCS